jgi:hypothetical protein
MLSRRFGHGVHLASAPCMAFRANLVRVVVPLVLAGFVVACGGRALGESGVAPGDDSGVATDLGIGTGATDSSIGTGATDGGAACLDLEVLPSDLTCGSDSDCELVRAGEVCSGQCSCSGYTPVNAAAGARFRSEIASLTFSEDCGCPASTDEALRCIDGQCTLCTGDPPAGCGHAGIGDGGIVTVNGGGGADTGTDSATESSNDSAGTCNGTDFCACINFCVSTCRCGDGGCPLTQACGGGLCPNSCPSGEACAAQPGDVSMCSPTCTPDGVDRQGSCPAGMTCQIVCT